MPWGFSLSPDGTHLVVTAWVGATISAFRINEKGDLQKVGSLETEKNIFSVTTR
jgi:6-phosphogluconolactonase (cycloisomerase 2 family)